MKCPLSIFNNFLFVSSGHWECQEWETAVTLAEIPWSPGEPNNNHYGSSEDCAVLSFWKVASGKWGDILCSREESAVCKQSL